MDLKAEMTSRKQILTAKQSKLLKSLKKTIPRSQVVRIIDGDNELKKQTTNIVQIALKRPASGWLRQYLATWGEGGGGCTGG